MVDFAEWNRQEVRVFEIALYVIDCWKSAPAHQLANSLHFRIWFEEKKHGFWDDNIHIYNDPFLHFFTLGAGWYEFLFLWTWEDSHVFCLCNLGWPTWLCALMKHPYLLIVIVKTEVEFAQHLFVGGLILNRLCDEVRDHLEKSVKLHGRTPFPLTIFVFKWLWNDLVQKISAISQAWCTKLEILNDKSLKLTVVLVMMMGG